MITLIATIKAKQGQEKELADLCVEMAKKVRENEKGCLKYVPYVSLENPEEVVFIEKYKTAEDLDKHRKTAHYQEIVKNKIGALLAEAPELEEFD